MCDVTIEQCKEIIEEFEPTPMGKQENHFTLDGMMLLLDLLPVLSAFSCYAVFSLSVPAGVCTSLQSTLYCGMEDDPGTDTVAISSSSCL